jgi:DNA polymerase delta subunit 2
LAAVNRETNGTFWFQTLRRTAKDRSDLAKQPVEILSEHLLDIANSIPLHILPGETDPTGAILPQQALPHAMFGPVSALRTFHSETNPTVIRLMSSPSPGQENTTQTTRNILATSGQTLDDMFKYVHTPPTTRLDLAEATLRWRHLAPTAPDTLWCHPYFTKDPFVLEATPDLYLIGNQPEFATRMVVSTSKDAEAVRCRAILVPSFSRTGILVLVDTHTLDVKTIEFAPSEAEHIM